MLQQKRTTKRTMQPGMVPGTVVKDTKQHCTCCNPLQKLLFQIIFHDVKPKRMPITGESASGLSLNHSSNMNSYKTMQYLDKPTTCTS